MVLYWEFQNINIDDFSGYTAVERCYPENGWTDEKVIEYFEDRPSDFLLKVCNENGEQVYYEYDVYEGTWVKS